MELKEFIKSTIKQIAESVDELNQEFDGKQTFVNPTNIKGVRESPHVPFAFTDYNVTNIDFDLSVDVENKEGTTGKVGVLASVIGVGVSSTEGRVQHSESKVRFTIPVVLPSKKLDPNKG